MRPPPPCRRCASTSLPGTGREMRARVFAARDRAVGEGAGQPGLARCFDFITVSTRWTPRAVDFHTTLRLAGRLSPYRNTAGPLLTSPWVGRDRIQRHRPDPQAARRAREAIHRPPRGPPDSPSPGLHRSTTARRHRERGSDALPVDGMAKLYARFFLWRVRDADEDTMWRENSRLGVESLMAEHELAAQQSAPGAEVHHEGHNGFTKDTTGPAGLRLPSGRRHRSELRARARGGRRGARSRRVLRAFFVVFVMNLPAGEVAVF